jgi:HAMP domain-containing protein
MAFWKKSLMAQLVTYFLLLSLMITGAVAFISFWRAREALLKSVDDRLEVANTLKTDALDQWAEDRRRDILLITELPDIKTQAQILLTHRSSEPEYQAAYETLSQYLADVLKVQPNLQEVFVVNKANRVLVSTNKEQENLISVLTDYIEIQRDSGANFRSNFYPDPSTGEPRVTFRILIVGIVEGKEQTLGTLAMHMALNEIGQIIGQSAGLGETGETYLVADLSSKRVKITGKDTEATELAQNVESFGINQAMKGENKKTEAPPVTYNNYAGVPVIGNYSWVSKQDVGLLVELTEREAFRPAQELAIVVALTGLASAAFLTIGVYLIASRIAHPILIVTDVAAAIEAGSFNTEQLDSVATRADEVGLLARVFQRMAREVYAREQRLKQQVQELQIVIDEAKRESSVSEITDSDFFQDLTQKAQRLRAERNERTQRLSQRKKKKDGDS